MNYLIEHNANKDAKELIATKQDLSETKAELIK
jgi:hypothetical protein